MTTPLVTGELWWKNAVMYCLDVETYLDSDGDGTGDFSGLTKGLDHLASLGVNCIWLLPFQPSTADDGYAITDFYAVDPRYGTLGDFVTFLRSARDRGIRVIVDVVANHTSDQHPWFLESRSDRRSPRRDWYIWSEDAVPDAASEVYPGEQDGNWAFDEATGQYYFHRFYPFQPDLNWANPAVRKAMLEAMGFWLELGVSGFRLDAAPFIAETMPPHGRPGEVHHEWLREIHDFVTHRRGDAVLIGEANVEPDRVVDYFGDGREMQLLFDYFANAALIAALAAQSAEPLRRHLDRLPKAPHTCGWLNFVRIHDELSLERLDDDERQRVFERFAPEERMRIYGRGIRRRVAPMLDDDRRLRLAYSLAFSTPGMPLLLYGDELGMGDDLALDGRLSVRTPMQWDRGPTGGFSAADPERLVRPVVDDPRFAPDVVNVSDELQDPHSLLSWMRRLIEVRRHELAIGQGESQRLDVGHDDVVAHCCRWQRQLFVAVHNLADEPRCIETAALRLDDDMRIVFSDDETRPEVEVQLELAPYGYRWFARTTAWREP